MAKIKAVPSPIINKSMFLRVLVKHVAKLQRFIFNARELLIIYLFIFNLNNLVLINRIFQRLLRM